jgi:hypothetical protein
VSTYGLQKAIFEYLNLKQGAGAPALEASALRARYDLTEVELQALLGADVVALARLGVHPVLLNSYARSLVPRDQYRAALTELEPPASDPQR